MTEHKHSPLPFMVKHYSTERFPQTSLHRILDANDAPVPTRNKETADFIVKACNAHYELVEALKHYELTYCEGWCSTGWTSKHNNGRFEECAGCIAREAIRKAGVE